METIDKLDQKIQQLVKTHYESSSAPLLLSQLGKSLRVEGFWPSDNGSKTLREVIEGLSPDILVKRDPDALAFAVVVTKESEHIADTAIETRRTYRFLNDLPRSLTLAFVVEVPSDQQIFVQRKPPFRYQISDDALDTDEYALVNPDLRVEGVYVDRMRDIDPDKANELATNIRDWISKNGLSLEYLRQSERHPPPGQGERLPTPQSSGRSASALERLLSAQPRDVARRMVIPADIALALSRIP